MTMEEMMGAMDYRICHVCRGKMLPERLTKTFKLNGKEITIKGLEGYCCEKCGEIVFAPEEARMIDKLVRAFDDKPTVDFLNLEETAEFLRVSNQTVYNMIRDGRIKAHKVGREWRFLQSDLLAYLDTSSNVTMAAKGGSVDTSDLKIISEEIAKRKKDDE